MNNIWYNVPYIGKLLHRCIHKSLIHSKLKKDSWKKSFPFIQLQAYTDYFFFFWRLGYDCFILSGFDEMFIRENILFHSSPLSPIYTFFAYMKIYARILMSKRDVSIENFNFCLNFHYADNSMYIWNSLKSYCI